MSLNLFNQDKIQDGGICISVGSEPIYTYSSGPKVDCSQTIKLGNKIEKREDEKSMGEKWRKIINEYELKTKKAYDLEEAKQAREIVFKDETVTAIAKVIKSKEKELDIDADKVMEGFYLYTDKFFKILSKETKAKLDEVAGFYSKKYKILNDKIAEIEAVLEMTETYEQMKEVLLQYGVLNWNEEK